MSFIRTKKRENPFVQIDKEFIGNGLLSLKATGLLTYILSKPDGWQIRMKDIQNRFKDGESSVRSAMNELMKAGYVNRYRERKEDGTLRDYIYEVYERPEYNPSYVPKRENHEQVEPPKRDFPELDNPELDNHVYSNNDFSNNDFSNKEEEEEESINPIIEQSSLLAKQYKAMIGAINPIIENHLIEWLKKLPYEVIKAEIENSALNGARSFKYLETTLKEDYRLGIKSIEDLDNKVATYKESKKQSVQRRPGKKQQSKKEIVPDWIDNKKEPVKNSNPEILDRVKQLQERLQSK